MKHFNLFNSFFENKNILIKRFERFFDESNPEMTIMQTDRTLLTYEILSRTPYGIAVSDTYEAFTLANNDPKIGIDRLIANGVFQAAYPLHDALRENLNRKQKKNDREVSLKSSIHILFRRMNIGLY